MRVLKIKNTPLILIGLLILTGMVLFHTGRADAAACTLPTTDYGTVTTTVNIPATGTYRVWSRIQIPNSTNDNYLLEIDGSSCYTVNDTAITANTWTWVDYSTGGTKINATLNAGSHTIKMIGTSDGVLVDRVIFTQDTTSSACNPPTGTGNSCANPVNVPPSVTSFSSSSTSTTTGTNYTLSASGTDSDGTLSDISIYQSGNNTALKSCPQTTATGSCSYTLSSSAAGTYTYYAKITDNDGAVTTSSNAVVTVTQSQTQLPGDVNNSGTVTLADLNIILQNWGKTGQTRAQGDLTGDTNVTLADLNQVLTNWTH